MSYLYRKVLLDDIIDRRNGSYINPVSLKLDQLDCDPPSTIEIESKYNPNPNYGQLRTDYIQFVIPIFENVADIGLYEQYDFIPLDHIVDEDPDMIVRKQGIPLENYLTDDDYFVTGQTDSKLNDIDYYGALQTNVNYSDEQGTYTGVLLKNSQFLIYVINGVDNGGYVANTGVKYNESLIQKRVVFDPKTKTYKEINLVNFMAKGQGWTADNVVLQEIVKDDKLIGIANVTEVENDININRGGYNVFENHYILGEIKSMTDLVSYRNNYFKLQ